MKVFVTGGAGYIGSHVVKRLAQDNHQITVYDNLSTGFRENITSGEFIHGDLNNTLLLNKVFKQGNFDVVMHFAGSIVVSESIKNPLAYYTNNVGNTINLLHCMLNHGVKKIVFSSTAAVYGVPNDAVVSEESPTAPINPYGESKLMVEKILSDLHRAGNLDFVALRYFNVVGAASDGTIGDRKTNTTHLVSNCFKAIKSNGSLSVFGNDYDTQDGTCIRDYIHVEDIAEAHVLGLHYLNSNRGSEIFNCGYSKGYSVMEVVNAVKKVTGVNFLVEFSDRRPGDPPALIAECRKIKSKLNWKPMYDDLETMINTAWIWELNSEREYYGY